MATHDLSGRFQEVLADFLEARERGDAVDPQALLRAHPEVADELAEFFANEVRLSPISGLREPVRPKTRLERTTIRPGIRIGEYELIHEIARGGMGVVCRARHVALHRVVALKMMLGGDFVGRDDLRRFRAEAEIVAGLDHPQLVPIFDIGEHDGRTFFCMKLIDGPSLNREIARFVGLPAMAARLIVQVARAVHHAHQRGVIHRDLKPGNILLEQVAVLPGVKKRRNLEQAYLPYVTDFGLAKRVQQDGQASQSTAVVGTAAYMAPEQATGGQALTVAVDVYSLGAILYELLTGQPPFGGERPMEVLLKVVNGDVASPLTLRPDLDPDVAQICLKCLRKRPQDRYPSAEALAVELEQWLAGEPLTVRAPTTIERAVRWCRRRPLRAFAAGVLVVAVALAIGISLWVNWRLTEANEKLRAAQESSAESERLAQQQAANSLEAAQQARDAEAKAVAAERKAIDSSNEAFAAAERERQARLEAEDARAALQATIAKELKALAGEKDARITEKEARAEASSALDKRRQLLVQQYVANGVPLLQRGDLYGAAVWFGEALELDLGDPRREEAHRVRLATTLRACPPLEQMWFFEDKVQSLRLSPSGDRVLVLFRGSATLLDAKTGQQVGNTMRHDDAISAFDFSPDGQMFAIGSSDGRLRIASASAGKSRDYSKHVGRINALAFSPDSRWIATVGADRKTRVFDVTSGKPVGKTVAQDLESHIVAFHPDGRHLLTAGQTGKNKHGEVQIWDLNTGKETPLIWAGAKEFRGGGFSRDGRAAYALAAGQGMRLWNLGGTVVSAPAHIAGVDQMGWISPSLDRVLQVRETEVAIAQLNGAVVSRMPHDSKVYLAQYSPLGKLALTGSANRGVRLWNTDFGTTSIPLLPHGQTIVAARFSANDQYLATATADNCVRLWNLDWPERERMKPTPRNKGALVSISPDGKTALLAQPSAAVVYDLATAANIGAPIGATGTVSKVCWSADGRSFALADEVQVRVYDAASGKPQTPVWKREEGSVQVAYLPATNEWASWDRKQIRLWDGAGQLERKLHKDDIVLDVTGQLAALRGKSGLAIEALRSGAVVPPVAKAGTPELLRFSPDGQMWAAAFADGAIRIFDAATGEPLTAPFFQGELLRSLVFSADNRRLAVAGMSGRIVVWEVATGLPLTPSLAPIGTLAGVVFSEDADELVAWTGEGHVHRWSLSPLTGKPRELSPRMAIAAGQTVHPGSGSLIPLELPQIRNLWNMKK